MEHRINTMFLVFLAIILSLFFLSQCDLILGSGERTGNVGIDLSGFYGEGRAISGFPYGITITGFRISVAGPGMERIEKYVSAGARYVNMFVPSGENRFFTLEVYFTIFDTDSFLYAHLRSYKGRAVADLRPGYFVGLTFRMTAGATDLLAPDRLGDRVYSAQTLPGFSVPDYGDLGFVSTLEPNDVDIDADGRIFVVRNIGDPGVVYAESLGSGLAGQINLGSFYALAIDRDANYNINSDADAIDDSNILYVSNYSNLATDDFRYYVLDNLPDTSTWNSLSLGNAIDGLITEIMGLAVDPWTHHLYIVGIFDGDQALIEYDPFYIDPPTDPTTRGRILNHVSHPAIFRKLNDVIVKDEGIFVLNQTTPDTPNIPVLLKFNRLLELTGAYGHSSAEGGLIVPSTEPGAFYHPKRFFARENEMLYVVDDSDLTDAFGDDYDKIVRINTSLESSSWQTFPGVQNAGNPPGENFRFTE